MKRLFALFVFFVSLVACGSVPTLPAVPAKPVPVANGLRANVGEVDITPPPGLALFGHGPEGRIARGARLRLRCQVFVLHSGQEAVALIPCDLAAPSLELQRRIAELAQQKGVPLGADSVLLFATHTHAGPAHYFGSRTYSGTFSSRSPGFDPDVLEFLAERIAGTLATTYRGLGDACLGWARDNVYGLSRNRSLRAHVRNEDATPVSQTSIDRSVIDQAQGIDLEGQESPAWTSPACEDVVVRRPGYLTPSQAAVDPSLNVMRITEREGDECKLDHPLGVFAVFGVHPTAIANTNDLYHGDVFGYATREATEKLGGKIIVGIANGAEGDVSPAWDQQTPRESRRLGRHLAEHIRCLYDVAGERMEATPALRHAYHDATWSEGATGAAKCDRLCRFPELGTPAAGGAEDGPTKFRIVPAFNEGFTGAPRGCHRNRVPLVGPFGTSHDDFDLDFPNLAPLVALRVGKRMLVSAPAELTTMTAKHIREAVQRRGHVRPEEIVVTGLTNAYLQYVATEREYEQQDYEGASTLYGPCSEHFVANRLAELACFADGKPLGNLTPLGEVNRPKAIRSKPSPRVHRFTEVTSAPSAELLQPMQSLETVSVEGYWGVHFKVRGIQPELLQLPEAFFVELIDAETKKVLDTSAGMSFVMAYQPQADQWLIAWEPETDSKGCKAKSVRIRVNGPTGVTSPAIAPKCGRKP